MVLNYQITSLPRSPEGTQSKARIFPYVQSCPSARSTPLVYNLSSVPDQTPTSRWSFALCSMFVAAKPHFSYWSVTDLNCTILIFRTVELYLKLRTRAAKTHQKTQSLKNKNRNRRDLSNECLRVKWTLMRTFGSAPSMTTSFNSS